MSWDPIWENIFKKRGKWGEYPDEILIRFIAKFYYKLSNHKKINILDLGSGYGASTWYLCREGFNAYAIDGSYTITRKLKQRLKRDGYMAHLVIGEFERLPFPNRSFNCVIDILSLMCNNYDSSRKIVNEVYRVLKKSGMFFSYIPQTGCWGDGEGKKIGHNSYRKITLGPFANTGTVRFTSEKDISDLYSPFSKIEFEEIIRTVNNRSNKLSYWAISCVK